MGGLNPKPPNNNLSKTQLWKILPEQVQYQTFNVIIDYLEKSNKIIITKSNKIVWIFADNPKARKLIEESVSINA